MSYRVELLQMVGPDNIVEFDDPEKIKARVVELLTPKIDIQWAEDGSALIVMADKIIIGSIVKVK